MLQRILGTVLVIAGLVGIAFGVASATVLKESDTVVATARPAGDGTVVVTDPGVLGMVASDVTVTATVPEGQQVTLVAGRDVDVLGWLGDDAYTRVTGMTDWETLSTEAVAAAEPEGEEGETAEEAEEPAEPEILDPSGSDMWVSEQTEAGEVSLRWTAQSGPWMVMAAGTGAAPVEDEEAEAAEEAEPVTPVTPTLQLTWARDAGTPLLWPSVVVGALLLLAGLALLGSALRRRKRDRADDALPAGTSASSATSGLSAASARSADDVASATSPFGPTSVGSTAAAWPAAVAGTRPAPEPDPAPAEPVQDTDQDLGRDADAEDVEAEGSGTAPVPVAGRFSRRSLLGRGRSRAAADDADEQTSGESAEAGAPQQAAAEPFAPEPVEPQARPDEAPAVANRPLTRRELRLQEEARRSTGQQSTVSRALRAFTGQTPVVPAPATDEPTAPAQSPAAAPRRASTWRETWGFDPSANGAADADETTEETNR